MKINQSTMKLQSLRNSIRERCAIHIGLLLVLGMVVTTVVSAQNETGVRNISESGFRSLGYWYDSSRLVYQERYPILRSLPPVATDMPYGVMRSYLYIDSLLRFDVDNSVEERIAKEKSKLPLDSSLRYLAAQLYELADYDPLSFAQYRTEVSLHRGGKYRVSLSGIYNEMRNAFKRKALRAENGKALTSALYPDYVLRIHVVGIDSALDTYSADGRYRYRVTARVLDTIKGKRLPPCNHENLSEEGARRLTGDGATGCIRFQYSRNNYFDPNEYQSEGGKPLYRKLEPEFTSPDGGFTMKPDQDAVVFLSYHQAMFDSTADYFDLDLEMQASFNALPIINGNIHDINNVWSVNTVMAYRDWKEKFHSVRERILTGNY